MKRKILFIVPLPPPVHGSTMMCKCIKDSKLINNKFDCKYVNISASRSMNEVHCFKFVKIWRILSSYFQLIRKLMTSRYDLCYVALAFHKSLLKDAPLVFLCKLFGRKVVIHLHGKGASEDAKSGFYRWLLKHTFANTKVIMLSWLLYSDVEQFVKREDVSICPNGIPVVEREVKERNNIVPRLLFLSNLIESKGVYVLLDALQLLAEKGISFECNFVGGETVEINRKRFEEEVTKRGLNRLVLYKGKKYGEDKEVIFENSDIFVLPTSDDCSPLVLLEAMQRHLPCISTNIGGIKDLVEEGVNGLICDNKDAELLAESIKKLLDDPILRKEMGENGYEKFKKQYTSEAFQERMYEVLSTQMGGIS